jgi:ribose transport system substrate-binding protein
MKTLMGDSAASVRMRLAVVMLIGALAIMVAGCGSSDSGSSGGTGTGSDAKASSGAGDSGSGSFENGKFTPPPFTVAPASAEELKAAPGPKMKGPITGEEISLPFWNTLPVKDGPIGDPNKEYTLCVSHSLIHPFPISQKESAEMEAARHPNVKLIERNTDNDPLQQIRDLKDCMNRKVDGVLVYPHSVGPLTPVIEQLTAAGIPVVGMERTVATEKYASWIFLDTEKELDLLTTSMCKAVGNTGTVAEMPGVLGSSPQILRHGYLVQGLAKHCPDVKLVQTQATDFGPATGYNVGLQFLRSPASKDVKAIFVASTGAGEGLVKAEEQVGKKIPIFGVDASCKEIDMTEQGKFAGLVDHNPLHGDLALRILIRDIEKQPFPKFVSQPVVPDFVITPENAAQAKATCWGPRDA